MCSMQADEKELIAQSIAHDADAYGRLVDRYKNAIYRHCFALLRDEDSAEDIAQETFITAYYKLNSFDQSRKFSTWLFKIATNKCLNNLKRAKKSTMLSEQMIESIVSPHASPEEQADAAQTHRAVAKLRPEYRVAIELFYFSGHSIEEIAEMTGKPQGTIKGWMSRAKHQLRKELS